MGLPSTRTRSNSRRSRAIVHVQPGDQEFARASDGARGAEGSRGGRREPRSGHRPAACPSSTTSSRPGDDPQSQRARKHGAGQVGVDQDGPARPRARARARVRTRVMRPSARWQLVNSRTLCRWRSRTSSSRSAICSNRSPQSATPASARCPATGDRGRPRARWIAESGPAASVGARVPRSRTQRRPGGTADRPMPRRVRDRLVIRRVCRGSSFLRTSGASEGRPRRSPGTPLLA